MDPNDTFKDLEGENYDLPPLDEHNIRALQSNATYEITAWINTLPLPQEVVKIMYFEQQPNVNECIEALRKANVAGDLSGTISITILKCIPVINESQNNNNQSLIGFL